MNQHNVQITFLTVLLHQCNSLKVPLVADKVIAVQQQKQNKNKTSCLLDSTENWLHKTTISSAAVEGQNSWPPHSLG